MKKKEKGAINQTDDRDLTAGEIALDLINKDIERPNDILFVEDQSEEQLKNYMEDLYNTVDRGRKMFPNSDFFINCLVRKNSLLQKFMRIQFLPLRACPNPNYDQSVFKFHHDRGDIEYLWTVPDFKTTYLFLEYPALVPEDERHLLRFVHAFNDGTLLEVCKSLNNEKKDSIKLDS